MRPLPTGACASGLGSLKLLGEDGELVEQQTQFHTLISFIKWA